MLAGHFVAPRRIELIEHPEPELSADEPGQIIFQPQLACLCGSDLPYFEGDYPEFAPEVGQSLHEMIGVVVASNGDRFSPGDRVLCVPHHHFGLFERFKTSQASAVPLDTRAADDHILLSQPLGTVICALRKLPNLIGLNTVVVGQGPMGQLFCAALRSLGARQIIAVEPLEDRLAVSPRMGATLTVDPQQQDPVQAVREATAGAMADLVVEVVGHREQQLNLCIQLCRPHGQLLMFGVPCETVDQLHVGDMFWKNLNLQTSVVPDFQRDFPLAMQWIAEGRIDVAPIITHRYPLQKIEEAFHLFHQRRDGALKVMIDFPQV